MKILFYAFTLLMPGTIYQQTNFKKLENEKYLNFLAAVQNTSTFNYFSVIKVKNLNSGEIKEICTKGNFIDGAIHLEFNFHYDPKGFQKVLDFEKEKKDRYFEFKNKKALEIISFFDYKPKQQAKLYSKYNFEKVIEIIKKKRKFSIRLNDEEMKLFAHVLFNKGYLIGESDCFGGTLEYVDRTTNKY